MKRFSSLDSLRSAGRPSVRPTTPSRKAGHGRIAFVALAVVALAAAACGDDADENGAGNDAAATVTPAAAENPSIVVTTGIWADVVANVVCDGQADIETLIPVGGDPHGFEPSLQDRSRMENAALVVANGLDLEEGLEDTLEAVAESGTPVFEFADGMEPLESSPAAHDDHGDEDEGDDHGDEDEGDDHGDEDEGDDHGDDDHGDEDEGDDHGEEDDEDEGEDHHGEEDDEDEGDDHGDEDEGDDHGDEDEGDDHGDEEGGHGHSGTDPHVWFDPVRVADALPRLAAALVADAGLDAAAVDACLQTFEAQLAAVHADIASQVSEVPVEQRKLVTNHEALGYYADRYGFEVIGTVIPTPNAMAQTNPAQLEELAELIEHEQIPVIFAETLHTVDDVEALAARVGDVEVVTLYTGSLGPAGSGADTYIGFLRTNTELIVDALG